MLFLWLLPVAAAASSIAQPWSYFLNSWPGAAPNPRRQRFTHSEHAQLRDGRSLHLSWEVHADPESILALDWEHERGGVELTDCGRDYLVLRVPRELTAQSTRWQFVTLSSHRHNCKHLRGRHLYHRVLGVASQSSAGSADEMKLRTEEVDSPSHLFHHYNVRLALTPPRAPVARRLQESTMPMALTREGNNWTFNWSLKPPMPMKFNVSPAVPGLVEGVMSFDVRTLEAVLGAEFSHSSTKNESTGVPCDDFWIKVDVNASVDADLTSAVKFKEPHKSTGVPAVIDTSLPFLPIAKNISFFIGPIPVAMTPSVDSLRVKIVHSGLLEGSMAMALKTNLLLSASVTYNSVGGLNYSLNASLFDSKVLPPSIIITDRDFKVDVSLMLNVSIRPFVTASINPRLAVSVGVAPLIPGLVTVPPALSAALSTPAPPLGLPHPLTLAPLPPIDCHSHDLEVSVSATLNCSVSIPMVGASFTSDHLPTADYQGDLGHLLPPVLCAGGYCQGKPPGCNYDDSAMNPIHIRKIIMRLSRHIKSENVDAHLGQAIAYGLMLFPSDVKIVDGCLHNASCHQLKEAEDALVESVTKAEADVMQKELLAASTDGLQTAEEEVSELGLTSETTEDTAAPEADAEDKAESDDNATSETEEVSRRLAARRHPPTEFDSFVIHLHTNRRITTELLQSLAHDGAFRIRDGREHTHGEIRVVSIGLQEPKPQQLWAQAAPAAARVKAPAAATKWGTSAIAFTGLVALSLVVLSSARFFSRRPQTYARMPEA